MRILITASGGDLAQSVIKALRLSRTDFEIHGCDVDPYSYATAFVDHYHCVPLASDSSYLGKIDALCRMFRIKAVFPVSEAEMFALGEHRLPDGAAIVSQRGKWLKTFADKLTAMQALEGNVEMGLFADGTNMKAVNGMLDKCGYPVVVKPRCSSGSRGVSVVNSKSELDAAVHKISAPIVQEFADESGGEFSSGVFCCKEFAAAIVFRRKLGPAVGLSWQAEVADLPEASDYALRVAKASGAIGSINVQFRMTCKGPRILEINPRFSSLVAARAACGFHDVEWFLALSTGCSISPPVLPFRSLKFRRFYHEVIDLGNGFGVLPKWQPRELKDRSRPGSGV